MFLLLKIMFEFEIFRVRSNKNILFDSMKNCKFMGEYYGQDKGSKYHIDL